MLHCTSKMASILKGSWEIFTFCIFNDLLSGSNCEKLNVMMIDKKKRIIKSVRKMDGIIRITNNIIRLNIKPLAPEFSLKF